MTNLDSASQQIFNLRERLERARAQATNNEEQLSEQKTKHDQLLVLAESNRIDPQKTKEYINAVKTVKPTTDRFRSDIEMKHQRAGEKKAKM